MFTLRDPCTASRRALSTTPSDDSDMPSAASHGEISRKPRAVPPPGCSPGPSEVLEDHPQRSRARSHRQRQGSRPFVQQQQIGRGLRDRRTLPHRARDVRGGEHRPVIDPVADHEHAVTVGPQFSSSRFAGGRQARVRLPHA